MITPNEVEYCNTNTGSKVLSITYPSGASTFSLIDVPVLAGTPIATINSSTGVITFNFHSIVGLSITPGIYEFIVRYNIPSSIYSQNERFTLKVKRCNALNKNIFYVCKQVTTNKILKIRSELGNFSSCSIVEGSDAVFTAVNSEGDVTYTPETTPAVGSKTLNLQYTINGYSEISIITLNIIDCVQPSVSTYEECVKDPIRIVWLNNNGGWDNYLFSQDKSYEVDQEGATRFFNSNNELKHASRGRVYNVVECINDQLPISHIDKIKSLRNSIQAYVLTSESDYSEAYPIYIDQANFKTYETANQLHSANFRFMFAKPLTIQEQ